MRELEIKKPEDFRKLKPSDFAEKILNVKLYPYQKYLIDNLNNYYKFKRRLFK